MNLTTQQRRVLMAALQSTGASIEDIAKVSKVKVHTARYVIEKFQTNGMLCPYHRIRFSLLNLRKFVFYFTVAPDKVVVVCRELQRDPRVVWLSEHTGTPRFEFVAVLKDPCEMDSLLTQISKKTGAQFKHRLWAIESHFYSFGSRYLGCLGPKILWHDIDISQSTPIKVSKLDLKILELLCGDSVMPGLPVSALARKLGQPQSTVSYHIKKLIDSKLLSERMYYLNIEFAKLHQYTVLITLEASHPKIHEQLIDFCHENLTTVCLTRAFGGWDYQVTMQSETKGEVLATVDILEERFQGIFSEILVFTRRRILASHTKLANHPEMALCSDTH
jgi:DNA-binding MarR family transcriptional regulator